MKKICNGLILFNDRQHAAHIHAHRQHTLFLFILKNEFAFIAANINETRNWRTKTLTREQKKFQIFSFGYFFCCCCMFSQSCNYVSGKIFFVRKVVFGEASTFIFQWNVTYTYRLLDKRYSKKFLSKKMQQTELPSSIRTSHLIFPPNFWTHLSNAKQSTQRKHSGRHTCYPTTTTKTNEKSNELFSLQ